MGVTSLRKRPFDAILVFFFCVFATSSLIYEQFVVFGVDLSTTTDVFGRSWYWYARSFDPVFLDPPLWLRIMCTIDAKPEGWIGVELTRCWGERSWRTRP